MSSQAETKQVLPVPSATLEKVIHVPLIADGLSYVHSVIEAHPLLKRTYSLGESVVPKVLDLVKPVASLFATPLKFVDGMGLKVLNFAEAKFPYPFRVTGPELVSQVQKPVDQTRDMVQSYTNAAHKAYDERIVAPARSIYEQVGDRIEGLQNQDNVYLQKAATTVVSTHKQLLQLAQDWGKKAEHETAEGVQKAEGVLKRLNTELENLHKFATSLPAESQKRLEPLLNTLQDTYKHAHSEVFDSSAPIQERASKMLVYLRDDTLPSLKKLAFEAVSFAEKDAGLDKANGDSGKQAASVDSATSTDQTNLNQKRK